jgi:NADPH:quinone reductase-like Zn-dependent oxidoreductase
MKAAVVTRYGSPDVVKVREAPKPIPAPDEVLIRVHATTVNRTDYGELRPFIGRIAYGLRRPRRTICGMDFAGEVEATGAGVASFQPGDGVFGMCPPLRNGAHAEYVSVPESGAIATMPETTPSRALVSRGSSIFWMRAGSVMKASSFIEESHLGQVKGSTS